MPVCRSQGFDGKIVLVSADSYLPYDRPTLSKNPDAKVSLLYYNQKIRVIKKDAVIWNKGENFCLANICIVFYR